MRSIACLALLWLPLVQGCTIVAVTRDLSESHSVEDISEVSLDPQGHLVATVTYACGRSERVSPPLQGPPPVSLHGPLKRLPVADRAPRGAGTQVAVVLGQPHIYELIPLASGRRHWQRVSLAREVSHYTAGRILAKAVLVTAAFAADVAVVALFATLLKDMGGSLYGDAVGTALAQGAAGTTVGIGIGIQTLEPPPRWIVTNRSDASARVSLYGAHRYHRELSPGEDVVIEVVPGRYTSKIEVPGRPARRQRVTLGRGEELRSVVR